MNRPYSIDKRTIANYLIAITPISIALFVAVIGWLQWKTADKKLRLDLYDRRFSVYSNTVKFFNILIDDLSKNKDELDETRASFLNTMLESQFLFDADSGR